MAFVELKAALHREAPHSCVADAIGKILPVILAEETHLAASMICAEAKIPPVVDQRMHRARADGRGGGGAIPVPKWRPVS